MHLVVAFLPALLAQAYALLVHHHLIKQVAALPHLLAHVVVELVLELLLLALFNGGRLGRVIPIFSSLVVQHTGRVVVVILRSVCSLHSPWAEVIGAIWVRPDDRSRLSVVICKGKREQAGPPHVLRDSIEI